MGEIILIDISIIWIGKRRKRRKRKEKEKEKELLLLLLLLLLPHLLGSCLVFFKAILRRPHPTSQDKIHTSMLPR